MSGGDKDAPQTPVGGHAGGSGLSRPCANGAAEREVPAAPPTGPTTDCPSCGRTARDCNDSHAKGWDGCCLTCDGVGRVNAHRLRETSLTPPASGDPQ